MIQDQEKQEKMDSNDNVGPFDKAEQTPAPITDAVVKFINEYSTPEYDAGGGNVVTENSNQQLEPDQLQHCYTNGTMEEFFKNADSHNIQRQQNISIDIQGQNSPEQAPISNRGKQSDQMKIIECGTEESLAASPKPTSPQLQSESASQAIHRSGKCGQVMQELLHKFHLEEEIVLNEQIIDQVEEFGYARHYIIDGLKNHDLNSATTSYLLLHFSKRGQIDRFSSVSAL